MDEMNKLHEMLLKAGINHTFMPMPVNQFGENALQIRIYRDNTFQEELDDVVFHKFSMEISLDFWKPVALAIVMATKPPNRCPLGG